MAVIETRIKDFVHALGREVVGIEGPERLDGPPSVGLDYPVTGARSVISMAMPTNVDAIYDFLSKKSPAPHNLDQFRFYDLRLKRAVKKAGKRR